MSLIQVYTSIFLSLFKMLLYELQIDFGTRKKNPENPPRNELKNFTFFSYCLKLFKRYKHSH